MAEKAAGDLGMVMEAFERGAAGMVMMNGGPKEEEIGGQEMAVLAR